MITFGVKIKDLRKEKNLTQKELAQALSITVSTLSHWECDYQEPNFDDLIMIADYFDVSLDYLLGREDDNGNFNVQSASPALTAEEQHLLDTFRKLNTKNRIHVSAYADIRLEDQDTRNTGNFA